MAAIEASSGGHVAIFVRKALSRAVKGKSPRSGFSKRVTVRRRRVRRFGKR
jgi:hypothetical protein